METSPLEQKLTGYAQTFRAATSILLFAAFLFLTACVFTIAIVDSTFRSDTSQTLVFAFTKQQELSVLRYYAFESYLLNTRTQEQSNKNLKSNTTTYGTNLPDKMSHSLTIKWKPLQSLQNFKDLSFEINCEPDHFAKEKVQCKKISVPVLGFTVIRFSQTYIWVDGYSYLNFSSFTVDPLIAREYGVQFAMDKDPKKRIVGEDTLMLLFVIFISVLCLAFVISIILPNLLYCIFKPLLNAKQEDTNTETSVDTELSQ